ncbi:hypothetical protein [Streptomyces sp. NPDC060188]|uniref:hypothetical protein n=1 Tax=Streptomyces sp. NPDC060188 TaxID=3347068 RepID=UPI003663F12B
MRRVVFDSNAIDPIADTPEAYERIKKAVDTGALEVLYTHISIDELAEIPDLDRRQRLLLLLVSIGRLVATGSAVLDFSRLDFCRLGADEGEASFDGLRSGSIRHTKDALIADTAAHEHCALVTNERRLTKRAAERGIEVLTTRALLDELAVAIPEQRE